MKERARSRRSAGACSPFRRIRVTRACCSRRTSSAASAPSRSSPRSRKGAILCAAATANRWQQDRDDVLGEKEESISSSSCARIVSPSSAISTRNAAARSASMPSPRARPRRSPSSSSTSPATKGSTSSAATPTDERSSAACSPASPTCRDAARRRHAALRARARRKGRARAGERGAARPLLVASEVREIEIHGERQDAAHAGHGDPAKNGCASFFPRRFARDREVFFDPILRRVIARTHRRAFTISCCGRKVTDKVPLDEAAALLAARSRAPAPASLKHWDNAVDQWITRVNQLARLVSRIRAPALGDDERRAVVEQICLGATSYKEIKERPVWPTVKAGSPPRSSSSWTSTRPSGWNCRTAESGKSSTTPKPRRPSPRASRISTASTGELRIAGGRVARHPGPRAEPSPDPDHAKPRDLLEGELPEDQTGAAAEIPEARVALRLLPRVLSVVAFNQPSQNYRSRLFLIALRRRRGCQELQGFICK